MTSLPLGFSNSCSGIYAFWPKPRRPRRLLRPKPKSSWPTRSQWDWRRSTASAAAAASHVLRYQYWPRLSRRTIAREPSTQRLLPLPFGSPWTERWTTPNTRCSPKTGRSHIGAKCSPHIFVMKTGQQDQHFEPQPAAAVAALAARLRGLPPWGAPLTHQCCEKRHYANEHTENVSWDVSDRKLATIKKWPVSISNTDWSVTFQVSMIGPRLLRDKCAKK